jgi:hypothetical protein
MRWFDSGEALVQPLELESKPFVIDAQQMQYSGVLNHFCLCRYCFGVSPTCCLNARQRLCGV